MGGCGSTPSRVDDESKSREAAVGSVGNLGGPKGEEADFKKIHSACRWNTMDVSEIKKLLEAPGALVCKDDMNGNTPLHIAAQNGHARIMEVIINMTDDKGVLNAQNLSGNSPLHMAIEYDYYEAAKILVDAGADVDVPNLKGYAARKGIEGSKHYLWMPVLTDKSPDAMSKVLTACKDNAADFDKSHFAGFGLRLKRSVAREEWATNYDETFKSILSTIPA